MKPRRQIRILLIGTLLLLVAGACRLVAPPPALESPASEPPASEPPASQPSVSTPTPVPVPDTPIPASPTPAGMLPPPITPQNAAGLAPHPLDLPAYAQNIFWPSALPADFPPAGLLVLAENQFYPVVIDPPGEPAGPGQPFSLLPENKRLVDLTADAAVLAVEDSGTLTLQNLSGQIQASISAPAFYGAGLSPDGKYLVVTSQEKWQADVYDAANGQKINTLTGFETAAPVYGVIIAPGGQTIAWYARATLLFQDVATGEMGRKFGFEDFIVEMAFAPDGKSLALSVAGRLEVVAAPGGEQLASIELSQPLRSLAFSPDGRLLAGAYGSAVQIWDTTTWTPVAALDASGVYTSRVSFSPDGRYLASTDENNRLIIWWVQ